MRYWVCNTLTNRTVAEGDLEFALELAADLVDEAPRPLVNLLRGCVNFLEHEVNGTVAGLAALLGYSRDVQRATDALKGSAANLGLLGVERATGRIERTLRDVDRCVPHDSPLRDGVVVDEAVMPADRQQQLHDDLTDAFRMICVGYDSPVRWLIQRMAEYVHWVALINVDAVLRENESLGTDGLAAGDADMLRARLAVVSLENFSIELGEPFARFEAFESLFAPGPRAESPAAATRPDLLAVGGAGAAPPLTSTSHAPLR